MIELGPIMGYKELIQYIPEEDIAKRYIPNYKKLNHSFRLRPCSEDKHPSCRVFPFNGRLLIKDFGDSSNPNARSIIQFIQDEYHKSYVDAITMVLSDFKLNITRNLKYDGVSKLKNPQYNESETIIQVKYRDWKDYDIEYWGKYGITLELLTKADVRPISYFTITSKKVTNKLFKASKYSYTYDYYYHKDVFRRKIYQPYDDYMKWISNCSLDVVQNYINLPKTGDLLIIQSSLKDSLVMNTFGYESIAPISEAAWFTDEYFNKIKDRFKTIIYFSNNDWDKQDNPGLNYGKSIREKHKIPIIYLPTEYKVSDISDFRNKYDADKTFGIINKLIKEI